MLDRVIRWRVSGGENEGEVHGFQRVCVCVRGEVTRRSEKKGDVRRLKERGLDVCVCVT